LTICLDPYADENTGVAILRRALEEPMKQASPATPAKMAPSSSRTCARKQADQKNTNIGYNVLSGEYLDMIEAGILDPAKVTRGALENAASIAAMILTTEALITDLPEENAPPMPGGGMPDMGY
jgi:chaperonin GroEL